MFIYTIFVLTECTICSLYVYIYNICVDRVYYLLIVCLYNICVDRMHYLFIVCLFYMKGYSPVVYKVPLPERTSPLYYPLRGELVGEAQPEEGITYLSDGQVLEVEGAKLQVIATPGHTADHLCLWLEQDSTVFTADCILGEGTAVRWKEVL